jgi:hypothetical protein
MSVENQSPEQVNETLIPVLYDVSAPQRVYMQTERQGRLYNVVHIIDPIGRETLLEFERALQVRVSDADTDESDEQDAKAVTSNAFNAGQAFYDSVASGTERYTFKNPDDWKNEMSKSDKNFVVNGALLAAEFIETPLASDSEGCPAEDDNTSIYHMRCWFDGQLVNIEHKLDGGSAADLAEFVGIMGRSLLVQGTQFGQTDQRIPSRVLALEVLYDRVKVEATGYKDGRVPLHHKKMVAQRHFKKQQKIVAKNSNGSPMP